MKVFGVSEGSYSDYRVRCLFRDEELARQHAAALSDGDVEEFSLLDVLPVKVRWYGRSVRLNSGEGDLYDSGRQSTDTWDYEMEPLSKRAHLTVRYTRPWLDVKNVRRCGYWNAYASSLDAKAVDKTITDLIAQWRAQGYKLNQDVA